MHVWTLRVVVDCADIELFLFVCFFLPRAIAILRRVILRATIVSSFDYCFETPYVRVTLHRVLGLFPHCSARCHFVAKLEFLCELNGSSNYRRPKRAQEVR